MLVLFGKRYGWCVVALGANQCVLMQFVMVVHAVAILQGQKKQVKKDKLKSKWQKCVANVLKKKKKKTVQQTAPGCTKRLWCSTSLQAKGFLESVAWCPK